MGLPRSPDRRESGASEILRLRRSPSAFVPFVFFVVGSCNAAAPEAPAASASRPVDSPGRPAHLL